ncbi:MAG: acetyl-CoA acetyltransferase [Pseudomonadota bacterium]|nr:acetyl-CoA acetyltransferase [Pseudomonadota bacterium]
MVHLRGKTAIVATAESDLGKVAPDTTIFDLMGQATHRALEDCGLALSDIDGLFVSTSQSRMAAMGVCEYLGLRPRYFDSTQIGGSSFMAHITHAQAAIHAGMCEVALITYGSTQRTVSRAAASGREVNAYEDPYRPMMPPSAYALAASRHMYEYGTTREQLAEIAVAARQWALMNPKAWEKEPLSVDDVLNARMISHPLTVRDCCLVTDGGGAIIMTTAERAKGLKNKPAYILGTGEEITHKDISSMPDFTKTGAIQSGQRAYAAAQLSASDVDVAAVYDAFTICTLLFLEDLGFCEKGEGGAFVADGGIAPGGRFPVNTNGGGLSYCHPGMYGLLVLIEAARQIQGVCGPRQVAGAEIALAHGNGGVLSSQCTVLLGAEATL